jgi:hypothetical protein
MHDLARHGLEDRDCGPPGKLLASEGDARRWFELRNDLLLGTR